MKIGFNQYKRDGVEDFVTAVNTGPGNVYNITLPSGEPVSSISLVPGSPDKVSITVGTDFVWRPAQCSWS